jgi:hypothetical protein
MRTSTLITIGILAVGGFIIYRLLNQINTEQQQTEDANSINNFANVLQ